MLNYKIAIIHGENSIDEDKLVGTVTKFGEMDTHHIVSLLDYSRKQYPEIELFKKLNERHTGETGSYFLTKLNHVIFLNITSQNTKFGMFLFPDPAVITEKQKKALYDYCDEIDDLPTTATFFNLDIENGMVVGDERLSMNNETPREMVDLYFKLATKENDHKTK